jgi:hypothetical protein
MYHLQSLNLEQMLNHFYLTTFSSGSFRLLFPSCLINTLKDENLR